jgi:two-component system response regulator
MNSPDAQLVMIVEDSDDDYEATERALKKDGRLANPLIRFENAEEALSYLFRRDSYAPLPSAPRPGLILLDLNLPGSGGAALLKAVKLDPDLAVIPIVVLTTSSDPADVERCYRAGANSYITKPVNLDGFFNAIQELRRYWLEVAILPEPVS